MNIDHKPLYALTIGEFITFTKTIINEIIAEKGLLQQPLVEQHKDQEEHFTIKELCVFLHCSKVKLGLTHPRMKSMPKIRSTQGRIRSSINV